MMFNDLSERSQYIFKMIVDSYMKNGEPVGSATLCALGDINLSPATIRNIMAELEKNELLYAPHVSAGRLPTQKGLRFYIDGLMEIGRLSQEEQQTIDSACATQGKTIQSLLDKTSQLLSGLSNCASLVTAPKSDKPIKQIQFVKLNSSQILVVLVTSHDVVENRILETELDFPEYALEQASNYLNEQLQGLTILNARQKILNDIQEKRIQLDQITQELVKKGLALPRQDENENLLIIRGQSRLLEDVKALEELEQAKQLLAMLEEKETTAQLLNHLDDAQGVQIYIGAENDIFAHSGWSVILSPYKRDDNIVGAIGVIGPTRINYGKIVPIVDYTAKVMHKILKN